MNKLKLSSLLLALGGALVVAGCGGGSSSRPTITVKPEKQAGGPAVASNGSKKPDGGKQAGGGNGPGELAGLIKYTGTPPKLGLPPGYLDKDAFCTANKGKIEDDTLIVGASGGLQNVVIYLDRKPPGFSGDVPKEAVVFDQKFCTFHPHVLQVRAGQTVEVKNSDGTAHNTHTFPINSAAYNKSLAPETSDKLVYSSPERVPVKVKCDVHPWMSAYHVALDHPFVGITDKDGKFKIAGLPAGTYRFNIWHEKAGYLDKGVSITITPGKATELNRSYEPSKLASYRGPRPKVIVLSQR